MDPFRNYDAWLEAPYQAQFDSPECECDCDACMEGECEQCDDDCRFDYDDGDFGPADFDDYDYDFEDPEDFE